MNQSKKIVVDFDDTLAFTTNRNWEGAVPNVSLIQKLNALHDNGWSIDIFTARGSISCNTREEADLKYRNQIEKWLKDNNVKYNLLSFNKPLATYYIDDKGITPTQFLSLNIENLEGGLSGSSIYSDGLYVHKEDKNAHDTNMWYSKASLYVDVPKVIRVVGDVITMEYINHDKNFFKNNHEISLGILQNVIKNLKKSNETCIYKYTFGDYIRKIENHVNGSGVLEYGEIIPKLKDIHIDQTFSHGDFGITNLLFSNDKKVTLIDPIVSSFGCIELDIAKFIASLHINEYDERLIDISKNVLTSYNNLDIMVLKLLVSSEIIRIHKYHPDKNFVRRCFNNVFG